jgi:hypothetical protein
MGANDRVVAWYEIGTEQFLTDQAPDVPRGTTVRKRLKRPTTERRKAKRAWMCRAKEDGIISNLLNPEPDKVTEAIMAVIDLNRFPSSPDWVQSAIV